MEKEILTSLLQKHISGTLSESEKSELTVFIKRKQHKEFITVILEELLSQQTTRKEFDEKRFMPLLTGILKADIITEDDDEITNSEIQKNQLSHQSSGWKKVWWILIILIVGAAGAYFYYVKFVSPKMPAKNSNNPLLNEIAPGGNKAVLTLSDGSTVVLDSIVKGFLAQQGNAEVTNTLNGELSYKASGETNSTKIFNTLTTPRGGQYEVVLSDGTHVKLNAFSSITYPIAFAGKERNVTITGEVHFKIAKNAEQPFKVNVYDMELESLGTDFNVNAYSDESAIKITLVKGSVKLIKNTTSNVLQPSQQGQFNREGIFSLEKNVDTNEVVAWKNGLFQFNDVDLKTVMRQLSRWYDVDIIYENGAPADQTVFGEIRRNVNLSEVIKMLEKSDIHCRIEGKTLLVMP